MGIHVHLPLRQLSIEINGPKMALRGQGRERIAPPLRDCCCRHWFSRQPSPAEKSAIWGEVV